MPQIEDIGIAHVHGIVAEMGFLFREQSKHDHGIDAQIEIAENGKGTGRLIAIQIKSGESYIRHNQQGDIVYYSDERHIHYWYKHSLPVLLIIVSPQQKKAWWIDVKSYIREHEGLLDRGPYVIHIPVANVFDIKLNKYLSQIAQLGTIHFEVSEQQNNDLLLKSEEFYLKGNRFLDNGDYESALYSYSEAIKIDSNSAATYNNRGHVHNLLHNHQKALTDYNKAIQLDPLLAMAYNNRGFQKKKLGDLEGALRDYNQAIKLQSTLDLAYINRASLHELARDWIAALADYNKAIELNPNNEVTYNNRGLVHYELGQHTQALEDFNQAIDLNPVYGPAYSNRSLVHTYLHDLDAVIQDCTLAIRYSPELAHAYNNRAFAYLHKDLLTEAIHDCKKALKLAPSLSDVYNTKGLIEVKIGKHIDAIKSFQQALKLRPDSIYYSNVGLAFMAIGEIKKAAIACSFAIKMNPSNSEAYLIRHYARLKQGDKKGAREDKKMYDELLKK